MAINKRDTIVIASDNPSRLQAFSQALSADHRFKTIITDKGGKLSELAAQSAVALLIVDMPDDFTAAMRLIKEVLTVDAFVNCVATSDLDEESFHQESEGLGLLCKLPLAPDASDAKVLLENLLELTRSG